MSNRKHNIIRISVGEAIVALLSGLIIIMRPFAVWSA